MKRKLSALGFAVAVTCFVSARASEPGQPLDCSDWVFLEPGYACQEYVPYPCTDASCVLGYNRVELDSEGFFYRLETQTDVSVACGNRREDRLNLVRYNNLSQTVIAYIEDRCWAGPHLYDDVEPGDPGTAVDPPAALRFDPVGGRMFVSLINTCLHNIGDPPCTTYPPGKQTIAINGFTSTFEIHLGYTPENPLSFRVPLLPEGFPAADRFDTYYGNLATVGNWSQAQPLQCGYPASAPCVGDYLTVEDTLPTPDSGQGYYYVTAATHQGQTRYGRKSNGGVLTGRDPAVLPGCE